MTGYSQFIIFSEYLRPEKNVPLLTYSRTAFDLNTTRASIVQYRLLQPRAIIQPAIERLLSHQSISTSIVERAPT